MIRGLFLSLLGIGALAGALGLFTGFQLHRIQSAAQTEPQAISLADLIQNGCGDNAHVRVTDFTAGKPIVENVGVHAFTWLPLYPTAAQARKKIAPPVVLRIQTEEASLPDVLEQTEFTAVVSNRMPHMPGGTSWDLKLPAQFAKDYPAKAAANSTAKPPAKTILLASPDLQVAGVTFEAPLVYAQETQWAAWALGGVLMLLGLGGLLWMSRMETLAKRAAAAAEDASGLADEIAVSSHEFNTWEFARRGFKIFLFCGILMAFLAVLFGAGVSLLKTKPEGAYTVMAVSSGLMLINAFLIHSHYKYRSRGVARIDVCPSGLRWLKPGDDVPQTALWSQIADIELQHQTPYTWRHALTVSLHSGDVLYLAAFSLTDYHAFAQLAVDGRQHGARAIAKTPRPGGIPLTTNPVAAS